MNKEYISQKSTIATINFTAAKVESYREISNDSKTVRVYQDGKIGVCGCVGEGDFSELEQKAVKKLSDGIPYNTEFNANVQKSVINENVPISKEKLVATGKRLVKKISTACSRFLVGGKIQLEIQEGSYKNSANTDLAFKNSNLSVFFELKDKESANIFDAYYEVNLGKYGKVTEDKIVNDLKNIHDNFFTKKIKLPNGEYPMIFDPYDVLGFTIRNFIAEYYLSGGSLFSGKYGKKIFNEKVSFYIDRNPKTNRTTSFYDAEGEIAKNYRVPLVENGVVQTILTTKNTAKTFNLPVSKTAYSTYDGVPSLALPGIYMQSTAKDLREILGDKKAIYVAINSGGDITTDGVIGMPVMLAFLVENGEIKGRVENFNASGKLFEMLGDGFLGVSKTNLMQANDNEMLVCNLKLINE